MTQSGQDRVCMDMTSDFARWPEVSALLDEALDLDPDDRTEWMTALRARDAELATLVERLLGREAAPSPATTFPRQLLAALTPDGDTARAGQCFGHWRVLERIGAGGMGEVWRAVRADGQDDGEAAIKLLRSGLDRNALTRRFARERRVLARLDHPHISRLLDAGVEGDQPYLVLEYVRGQALIDYLTATRPDVATRVRLLLEVAQAVEYAHARLVVHRDLKPGNLMVTADGRAKLLDFGIAALLSDEDDTDPALTRLHGRGLTLDYAAPEQITGDTSGTASDVYSLGVLLFELLTGSRPFDTLCGADSTQRRSRAALEHAIVHDDAPRLSTVLAQPAAPSSAIPRPADAHQARGDLEAVVATALRKRPQDRYPTVAAFADDLRRWLDHHPVSARQGDWRYRSRLWLRRHRTAALLSTAVLLSLLAGLGSALWQWQQARAAASQAAIAASRAAAVSAFMSDLFRAADPERTRGAALTALEAVDAGAARLLAEGEKDPAIRAELGTALGETYVSLSRPDKAIPVLQAALDAADAVYGADDLRHAQLQLMLAKAQMQNEQYDVATHSYAEAIEALEAAGQGLSKDVILGRNYWAYAMGKTGAMTQAEAVMAENRTRAEKAFGMQDWVYAEVINDTATLATQRSDWNSARSLLASIEPLVLHPPQGHAQDALTMRLNFANTLSRTGDAAGAALRLPAIISDYQALLGAEANQVLVARWFLADTLKRTGQFGACADEYANLAPVRARVSGEQHPLTMDIYSKLAICQRLQGDLVGSRASAARAAAALPASDDPPQRTVYRTLVSLTALALDDGDTAQGRAHLARSTALMRALQLESRDDGAWTHLFGIYDALLRQRPDDALQRLRHAQTVAPEPMQATPALAYAAYVFALAGEREAGRQALQHARNALSRLPQPERAATALEFVEALIDQDRDRQRAALQALDALGPVPLRQPLSPFWFGMI